MDNRPIESEEDEPAAEPAAEEEDIEVRGRRRRRRDVNPAAAAGGAATAFVQDEFLQDWQEAQAETIDEDEQFQADQAADIVEGAADAQEEEAIRHDDFLGVPLQRGIKRSADDERRREERRRRRRERRAEEDLIADEDEDIARDKRGQ